MAMRYVYLLLVVGMLVAGLDCAAQGQVVGRVLGHGDLMPVPGARVLAICVDGDSVYAFAGEDGGFVLRFEAEVDRFLVVSLGFEVLVVEDVDLVGLGGEGVVFELREDDEYLREILIWGEQEGSRIDAQTYAPVRSLDSRIWIRPALLRSTNTVNFQQFLTKIPGVTVFDNQVIVRGGGGLLANVGSRVAVVVDGVPQLTPDYGEVQWQTIPTELIGGSMVLKGANATIFGSNSLNGAIVIQTIWPEDKPKTVISPYYEVYDRFGVDGYSWWGRSPYNRGVQLSHAVRIGQRVDLVVGGNLSAGSSYLEGVSPVTQRASWKLRYRSVSERWSVGLLGSLTRADTYSFLAWANDSTGINRPFLAIDDGDTTSSLQRFDRRILQLTPYLKYETKRGTSHQLRYRYYRMSIPNYVFYPIAWVHGLDYLFDEPLGHRWTVQGGATLQRFGYRQVGKDLGFEVGSASGFAMVKYDGRRWRLNLGYRYEAYKADGLDWQGASVTGFGVSYELGQDHALRFNFNQGYRIPSILERSDSQPNLGIPIYPNPELRVEAGWTAELGYRWKVGRLSYFDAAFFVQDMFGLVDYRLDVFAPDSITAPYSVDEFLRYFGLQAKNISRTRFGGLDVSFNGELKLGRVPIRTMTGWMYVYPVNLEGGSAMNDWAVFLGSIYESMFSNSAFIESPILMHRQRTLVKTDVEADVGKWSLGGAFFYQSAMEKIDPLFAGLIPGVGSYRQEYPQHGLAVNLRASFRFGKYGSLTLIGRNVFNRAYTLKPARLEAPRSFVVQYRVEL